MKILCLLIAIGMAIMTACAVGKNDYIFATVFGFLSILALINYLSVILVECTDKIITAINAKG
jgi:hypothetical protein